MIIYETNANYSIENILYVALYSIGLLKGCTLGVLPQHQHPEVLLWYQTSPHLFFWNNSSLF